MPASRYAKSRLPPDTPTREIALQPLARRAEKPKRYHGFAVRADPGREARATRGPSGSTRNVEWPGGIAPPGSHRTVRDSLPSYGSYRPTGGGDEVPMSERGSRRRMAASHSHARPLLRRNRLSFRMAQRTRCSSMRLARKYNVER